MQRLIVASSMSIYGEGLYRRPDGTIVAGMERSRNQLQQHRWELEDADGQKLAPLPTPESKLPSLASVYALSKFDQERLCLLLGEVYRIPTVALRFFNVFGPRQALSNPYTGVLAIFASRLLNNNRPLIFEDGLQQRDFVHVADVARACRLALETPAATGESINIGSGEPRTVLEVARHMACALNKPHLLPQPTNKYRAGDIRHCFADISLAGCLLGYKPMISFETGLQELAGWLGGEVAVDRVDQAEAELVAQGLTA